MAQARPSALRGKQQVTAAVRGFEDNWSRCMNDVSQIDRSKLKRIATAAMRIPTPENSQPWEINVQGNVFEIFHSAARAKLAEFPDDLSVFGIGLLAEALELAAGIEGVEVEFDYLLEHRSDAAPWLRAEFSLSSRSSDPLAHALSLRHTDRRIFEGGSLGDPVFDRIRHEASLCASAKLYFTDSYPEAYLQAIREADQIIMEWDEYRHDLTKWVRFTDKEIERKRDGMPWRSLLRKKENLVAYMRSRVWWLATLMDWYPVFMQKMETLLFDDSAELSPLTFTDGAGIGCITVMSNQPIDLIAAGRLTLRTWLLLNQQEYGFHPITNLPGTVYPLRFGTLRLPPQLSHLLINGYGIMQQVYGFSNQETPIFSFRVGKANGSYPSKARTLRRNDNIYFES